MKFTDRAIRSLKARETRYECWEDNRGGFGVRVARTGRISWILLYRFEKRPRRLTLGTYPAMSLAQAHLEAAQARSTLTSNIDPGALQSAARQAELLAPTVARLAEEYLDKWARPNKRSWREDERMLNKDVLPQLGTRKAKNVRRRDIVLLLDQIVDRGAPIQANRVFAVVRRMFNFAVERDIVTQSPCTGIRAPAKEHRRDRVLCEEEIKTFWNGLPDAPMAPLTKLALKFQLVTAQRKGEIVSAAKSDIQGDWWVIPAENCKNALPHRVPLSAQAKSLLQEIARHSGESPWLFPSPRGDQPMSPEAIDHALRRCEFGIPPFAPHDLRRTAASSMTAIGIPRLTVGKILNHVDTGVTAIYDRHSYDKEKRTALEAWSRRLDDILAKGATNVVPFSRTA